MNVCVCTQHNTYHYNAVQSRIYIYVVCECVRERHLKSKHDVDFKEDIECFARRIKLTAYTQHTMDNVFVLVLVRVHSFELQQCF